MIRSLIKSFKNYPETYDISYIRCFIAVSAFFICGGLVGTAAGGYLSEEAADELCGFIRGYLLSARGKGPAAVNLSGIMINIYVFPLLTILLGSSVIGFLLIPPLMGCRGFLLGYSAASVIRVFGNEGKLLIFAAYGINALFSIPCVFLIAVQAMKISGKLFASGITGLKNTGPYGRQLIIKLAMCCFIIFLTAILDSCLTPYFIRLAASIVV